MIKDMSNMTFGKLKVIKLDADNRKKGAYWICKCDCGKTTSVAGVELRRKGSRGTKSCGCVMRGNNFGKKYNTYVIKDDFVIGYTDKGEEFYIDKEDYDKVKEFCWHMNNDGYIQTTNFIKLHRLILGTPEDKLTDHINRIRYDNRKSNLRIATSKENAINITRRKDNSSGFTGVYYHKRDNLWIASISIDGKQLELLRTPSKELAIRARLKGELEYYGEYSPNYNKLKDLERGMVK